MLSCGKDAFGRNAVAVHEGAPVGGAVNLLGLRTGPIGADRRAEGGGTAAENDEIVSRRHGLTPPWRVVARPIAPGATQADHRRPRCPWRGASPERGGGPAPPKGPRGGARGLPWRS